MKNWKLSHFLFIFGACCVEFLRSTCPAIANWQKRKALANKNETRVQISELIFYSNPRIDLIRYKYLNIEGHDFSHKIVLLCNANFPTVHISLQHKEYSFLNYFSKYVFKWTAFVVSFILSCLMSNIIRSQRIVNEQSS